MGDAPHGPLVFGVEDDGGGGGGPCVGVVPLTYGNNTVSATTTTRYLSPAGEISGTTAQTDPIPYRMQAAGKVLRFEIRVRVGAGNANVIDYECMLLVGGVPTSFAAPMIISLPSTFVGVASIAIALGNAVVDGDEVIVEVRKALAVGTSPTDVQAFLQIEDECSGGGGGATCCAPQYLSQEMHQAFAFIYLSVAGGTMDLDASVCGQDEPITAVIRASALFPPGTPPTVTGVTYFPGTNVLRVAWDNTGEDGNFVLEITNACGCCYVHPLEAVSV